MIRYSVFYPAVEGSTFDHDYYRKHHVPLAVATWNPIEAVIDTGLEGPYVAAVHMTFASKEVFDAAMAAPGIAAVRADISNYTDLTPIRQISEFS